MTVVVERDLMSITNCYSTAAAVSPIETARSRATYPHSIASTDILKCKLAFNDGRNMRRNRMFSENRKSRFAIMVSRAGNSAARGMFETMENEMLHTPNYDVRGRAFCGPTAMSAITGAPISQIREIIREVWGKTKSNGTAMPVMGLDNASMLASMLRLGWKVAETADCQNDPDQRRDSFRLGDFLDAKGDDGPFIVNVTGHYYAVSQGEICDTFTCLPKDIARFSNGRKRWVKRWWKFEQA